MENERGSWSGRGGSMRDGRELEAAAGAKGRVRHPAQRDSARVIRIRELLYSLIDREDLI